eukprot:2530675-Prymnesium_polylepis.1
MKLLPTRFAHHKQQQPLTHKYAQTSCTHIHIPHVQVQVLGSHRSASGAPLVGVCRRASRTGIPIFNNNTALPREASGGRPQRSCCGP